MSHRKLTSSELYRAVPLTAVRSRPFLTADWHHVLAVTYGADAALLERHLPRGAQIDVGLGTAHDGRTRSYRVDHDVWALHHVSDLQLDVDFGALYGEDWRWLAAAEPSHITLAAGSAVRISAPVDV